jgi:ubiquinone/menaquinone biosynthesis C-methylase UbiE
MQRLTGVEERLDGPLTDQRALVGNLRDLTRVNRRLGGARLSIDAIDALAPGHAAISILDVGTGAADIPLALIDRGRARGRLVTATGLDSRPEVLAAAAIAEPRVTATGELALRVGDGRSLPYPDAAFDVVHSSMVVHHLDPAAARSLLTEMRRVARIGVVLNDLVRGEHFWLGAWLLSHVATRNAFTRVDAPMSVRRAYSVAEMTALLAAAGLRVERRFDGFAGHRVAFAARRSTET